MVQIFIQMSTKGECPEWTVIDLQGDLETRHPVPLGGKFIGDLHFTTKDQPVLIIGHHILYGKTIQLEKPFVVLTKDGPQSNPEDKEADEQMEEDLEKEATSYKIKAVIKTKLLFKTRPKPILAHVPKKV